jgi:hypothetical protein
VESTFPTTRGCDDDDDASGAGLTSDDHGDVSGLPEPPYRTLTSYGDVWNYGDVAVRVKLSVRVFYHADALPNTSEDPQALHAYDHVS